MASLEAEVQSLKAQLDWFKKQLFGQKSEKRLVDANPHQASLLAGLETKISTQPEPATEEITYTRRKGKQRDKDCVTEQGLRFDDSVPVERIALPAPGLNSQNQHEYEIIGEKITSRQLCGAGICTACDQTQTQRTANHGAGTECHL